MTDYISRQVANEYFDRYRHSVLSTEEILSMIPSAPVREMKRGKWIYKALYKCSVCGDVLCCAGNFCPTCGSEMRKGDEYGDL